MSHQNSLQLIELGDVQEVKSVVEEEQHNSLAEQAPVSSDKSDCEVFKKSSFAEIFINSKIVEQTNTTLREISHLD